MAQQENLINRKLALRWTSLRGRLWRITPGTLWAGRITEEYSIKDKKGRFIKVIEMIRARPIKMFKKGMLDNLGFEQVEITEDMIGQKLPVFCVVEAKTKKYKKITDEQREKLNTFDKLGVRCYIAREADNDDGYELKRWEDEQS